MRNHPYPFHQSGFILAVPPKSIAPRRYHQRPAQPPIVRPGFLVALVWSMCIAVGILV